MRILGYAAFLSIAVQRFVVYYEEPTLRLRCGDSYKLYRRSVPRWIARL
jgi:protein-S-isoprenylcysteine O-methyltransferase Ste14